MTWRKFSENQALLLFANLASEVRDEVFLVDNGTNVYLTGGCYFDIRTHEYIIGFRYMVFHYNQERFVSLMKVAILRPSDT